MSFTLNDCRFFCLILALILYGLIGSPTPDLLGVKELLIGILLLLSFSYTALFLNIKQGSRCGVLWLTVGRFLFWGCLAIGSIGAVIQSANINAFIRDLVGLAFLFLPLFLYAHFVKDERRVFSYVRLLLIACMFVGILFACRSLYGADPLYYLANMPSVLMAGIMCAGYAIKLLVYAGCMRDVLFAFILAVMSLVVALALYETLQRASLVAYVGCIIIITLCFLYQKPLKFLSLIAVFTGIVLIFFSEYLADMDHAILALARKTQLVGFNQRFEEWAAVWSTISHNPLNLIFGMGWGASFSSPAVADIEVRYTHSLLSSMLLKTGLMGVCLCLGYLYLLLIGFVGAFRQNIILWLAFICPLLIDIFLYASYKSLDFGLLLLLISLFSYFSGEQSERDMKCH